MTDEGDQERDLDSVDDRARERQRERSQRREEILGGMLDERKYPVTAEELAVEYADQTVDLPNETESLGSVFDRLVDERFESPDEAREAILNELTGAAGGQSEYNDERALSEFDEDR